ncbi:MAG TPA: glycosyl hydrolase, partial [Chitinophagaceae bacterium]|jgi:hypothetical protein|nr:glycosyl hydrolase [Chitinophagaceae bacterium]
MCEGLNRFVYHTFPHTPPESGRPGWVYNFGTLINTTNGWWPKSEGFHQYLARCSYLLQQGEFIGDVAFYYGDEAPNFVPPKHIPATLGPGYDYDVVNSEIILTRMTVRNGRIYLPHGQWYEVLVLPHDTRMNPQVLQKLEQLAAAGAIIIGPRPERSYSLARHQAADRKIQSLAAALWGNVDSVHRQERAYGKGKIIWGKTVREVLLQKGITLDVSFKGDHAEDAIDFIHRRTPDADIYFIRNKTETPVTGTCTFRVKNSLPEWWDAETGAQVPITSFSRSGAGMALPLNLGAQASVFIVFQRKKAPQVPRANPIAATDHIYTPKGLVRTKGARANPVTFNGPWEVRFEHKGNTPVADTVQQLASWHTHTHPAIKYFSGQATYYNSFEVTAGDLANGRVLLLALNEVREIAEVYLNGKRLGQHWHRSHRFALTDELKPGTNHLVIEVVNSINNSLVGDAQQPKEYRDLRSNITRLPNAWMKPFAEAPLLDAGLIGPVTFQWASLVDTNQ